MRFDSYHPMINFIYFFTGAFCAFAFDHPAYIAVTFLSFFIYSVKLNGKKALVFNLCLIPLVILYAGYYSYYNHFGLTPIGVTVIGNNITLESLCFGLSIGTRTAAFLIGMSCMFKVVTSDKVVYLFGKISPRLSLFLSVMLRAVPQIKTRAAKINLAQAGIGRGTRQGNILKRIGNSFRILSVLITWTLESFVESAASMRSRGNLLKGRTAFSIYRFDNRDRSVVIAMFFLITLTLMAFLLDQTGIHYDPQIVFNRVTSLSTIFYAAYAAFILLPMILQISGEYSFERARKESARRNGN